MQKEETPSLRPSGVPPLDPRRIGLLERAGLHVRELHPLGALVTGANLHLAHSETPGDEVREALEREMASRGLLVFRQTDSVTPEAFMAASCWWGGRELHSTHAVHPQSPHAHIFRLSNDPRIGLTGVGPQWHNDGSFVPETFSHAGYHMVRRAEKGAGTWFSHQGAAFDALPKDRQEYWERLSSVNSNGGVVHPCVHTHPLSGRKCIWLHLGMTGAVFEQGVGDEAGKFRLLEADELKQLCNEYNDLLNAGLDKGYTIAFDYQENDIVFIDNFAVGHRAAPEAHIAAAEQGLRIMHRTTVKGLTPFVPDNGLPGRVNIDAPNPAGAGVWHGGGIGFRWDDSIPMKN